MGAETFVTVIKKSEKKTPALAFALAQERARYEHGHGGYTGSIAEKTSFKLIVGKTKATTRDEAERQAYELIDAEDPRIDDKWGPAGCIEFDEGFLFFGWASS